MQDRFKFRLWDKERNKMYYDVCIGFIKDGIGTSDWVCADTEIGQLNYRDEALETIVIMQCTGLKDKNGKLIYEGDILSNGNKKYIVKWVKAGFVIEIINNIFRYPLGCLDSLEVIGNVFENKELLND